MKRHPRAEIVAKAGAQIGLKLVDLQEEYELTAIEFLRIVNGEIALTLKYMLREERHPEDPEKPADVE